MSLPDVTGQPTNPVDRLAALPDDSASRMYGDLLAKLDHARRCEQVWVMDLDWYKRMRRLASVQPEGEEDESEWKPSIDDRMLGKRILVRDGGGDPHIEWMTPDEVKETAAAPVVTMTPNEFDAFTEKHGIRWEQQ